MLIDKVIFVCDSVFRLFIINVQNFDFHFHFLIIHHISVVLLCVSGKWYTEISIENLKRTKQKKQ